MLADPQSMILDSGGRILTTARERCVRLLRGFVCASQTGNLRSPRWLSSHPTREPASVCRLLIAAIEEGVEIQARADYIWRPITC